MRGTVPKIGRLLLLILVTLAGCSQGNGISSLFEVKFGGLTSVEEQPDGSYFLKWEPTKDSSTVYAIYHSTLPSSGDYSDGVNSSISLSPDLWPTRAGTSIGAVKNSDSYAITGDLLTSGQADAFAVVVEANKKMIGEDKIMVVKSKSLPKMTIVSGNLQRLAPEATSEALTISLTAGGKPMAGEIVTFDLTQGEGVTLSAKSAKTDASGLASVQAVAGTALGPILVVARWKNKVSTQFGLEVAEDGAIGADGSGGRKQLVMISGDTQRTVPGLAFAQSFRVQALRSSSPVPKASVKFRVINGPPGTMTPEVAEASSEGMAEANYLPTAVGILVIEAQWESAKVRFRLQVSNEALSQIAGDDQKTDPGTTFGNPLVIKLERSGGPVNGESIQFQQVSGPPLRLSSGNAMTNSSGQASVGVTAGAVLGTAIVRASWQNLSTQFVLHVQPMPQLSIVTGNQQSTSSTANFAVPLQVQAMRLGQPVSGENVIFSAVSGPPISFSNALAPLNASGIAQTIVSPAAGHTGPVTVRASWSGQSVVFSLSVVDQDLVLVAGDQQTTRPNTAFAVPLQVRVQNSNLLVAGEQVSFSIVSGPTGILSQPVATADSSGIAQTTLTPGMNTGTMSVRASWGSRSVTFTLSVHDHVLQAVSGGGQSVDPGMAFATPLSVRLLRNGLPLAGEVVYFAADPTGVGVILANAMGTTDADGRVSVAVSAGSTSGSAGVQATWGTLSTIFNLNIASTNGLTLLDGDQQTTASNSAFALPLRVRAMRQGQPVSGESVTFSVVSGPSVSLSHGAATFDATGTAQTLVTPTAGNTGPLVIRASWSGQSVTFSNLTVRDHDLTILAGNGQSTSSSTPFGVPLQVRATRNGQVVSGEEVNFAIVSGPSADLPCQKRTRDLPGV